MVLHWIYASIDLFVSYAEEAIKVMSDHCKDGADEDWKKAAHRLKGSAANLGAVQLSALSARAEEGHALDKLEKQMLLDSVRGSYHHVRELIQSDLIFNI